MESVGIENVRIRQYNKKLQRKRIAELRKERIAQNEAEAFKRFKESTLDGEDPTRSFGFAPARLEGFDD